VVLCFSRETNLYPRLTGLPDREDVKFWNSYINGGRTNGVDCTTKIIEIIDITTRNGPLVIFCQLVHLAEMVVPLDQCRMALKDIEEVWDLQRKLIEDQRLPLYPAPDTVWEELGRLRGQVNNLCNRNVGEDRVILPRLLRTIETGYSSTY
jgi:hypothetical protein